VNGATEASYATLCAPLKVDAEVANVIREGFTIKEVKSLDSGDFVIRYSDKPREMTNEDTPFLLMKKVKWYHHLVCCCKTE